MGYTPHSLAANHGEKRASPATARGPIAAGDVLVGKYRVEGILGRGGMGIVVEATHLALRERVAIKVLRQYVTDSPDVVRFQQEARVVAKLRSEHVVRVRDSGTLDDGSPFMVMDLIKGETLKERITRTGPLSTTEATDFFLQICDAIAEAHQHGVIHRDLKPANVFVAVGRNDKPTIKVFDFGIAKLVPRVDDENVDLGVTTSEGVLGSPLYMPPKQLLSARDVDVRADIWSLGVTFFYMLTGELPFHAGSMAEIFTLVLGEAPRRVDTVVPDVPRKVADVVARCLEKDPAARFASISELVDALVPEGAVVLPSLRLRAASQPFLDSTPAAGNPSLAPSPATIVGGPPSTADASRSGLDRRRVIWVTASIVGSIAVGLLMATRSCTAPDAAREPAAIATTTATATQGSSPVSSTPSPLPAPIAVMSATTSAAVAAVASAPGSTGAKARSAGKLPVPKPSASASVDAGPPNPRSYR